VSFRRPYNEEPGVIWPKWQHWEVPLLRWLARQGIPVEVCAATDLHKDQANHTNRLGNYRLLVSVGHDEYWSKEMRDNVETFTKRGGNVAFFSGNVCWFQIRFDLNVTRQICYKDAGFDPFYDPPDPRQHDLVTVNWWDRPVCRAETGLTGVSYYGTTDPQRQYKVRTPNHWVFAGLDAASKQRFGTYDHGDGNGEQTVVGNETDKFQPPGSDPCVPHSPGTGFERLAEVSGFNAGTPDESLIVATMALWTQGKGKVFTSATLNWSLGLSQGGGSWNAIDQITRNVLNRLG